MQFRRFGKKILPNPSAPRTGFLPRMTKPAEIGNKTMLRAVDALLQMEGTAGTPSLLQSTEVVPVIDIRSAAIQIPTLRYIEVTAALAGLPSWDQEVYTPPENQYGEVIAADMTILFNPAPAAGNQIAMIWELADFLPNGSDTRIPVGGYAINNMLGTEANLPEYRAPLACCSVGGSASPPWTAFKGRVYGQNFGRTADPLGLFVTVGYFTGANVSQNFPADTSLTAKAWVLEYPLGQRP